MYQKLTKIVKITCKGNSLKLMGVDKQLTLVSRRRGRPNKYSLYENRRSVTVRFSSKKPRAVVEHNRKGPRRKTPSR